MHKTGLIILLVIIAVLLIFRETNNNGKEGFDNTNIAYPSEINVLKYTHDNDNIKYVNVSEDIKKYTQEPQHTLGMNINKCGNSICKTQDSNVCNKDFNVTFHNRNNTYYPNVDQKVNMQIQKAYMGENPYIKGVSYVDMKIENEADVDQIGSIPVNDYNGEPMPLLLF